MLSLRDGSWKLQYSSDEDDLVGDFYVPALRSAKSYDRATGYFDAGALRVAAQGVEGLVHNDGHMRLVVGCTLGLEEVEAIRRGLDLREAIARRLANVPLEPPDAEARDALELLAWMIARERLDVRVVVPCDAAGTPIAAGGIFHDKAGVITDLAGDRLAFNGSVNETAAGWTRNWESYDVFLSWRESPRVEIEVRKFERLWNGRMKRLLTVEIPDAVRDDLLRFLPENDRPARLAPKPEGAAPVTPPQVEPPPELPAEPTPTARNDELAERVWAFITAAPKREPDGMWVGPATAAVEPWPHQVRAYIRMWSEWPPKLLIADEVGLGKTIQAGLLLRQAWLSGRAKRVLVMAPKGILGQWQAELREKFNLHWPIYDGRELVWPASPAWRGRERRQVSRKEWLSEPAVLVSSHLVRRQHRAADLLGAEPWDLVVLDEAHHARRRGAGGSDERGPNALLGLMQRLAPRTAGLLLLTATPMQVHPLEVWDLLSLLGLPPEWTAQEFLDYYEDVSGDHGSPEILERAARLFRALERRFGPVEAGALVWSGARSAFAATRLLRALRDESSIPRRQLDDSDRRVAMRFLRGQTPVRRLVSRHTRELLRRYYRAGKISTPIADRHVEDRFITMSAAERAAYEAVEDYISSAYDRSAADERNAVGFVMTIYRRRLASSFEALRCTLQARLEAMRGAGGSEVNTEDVEDDDLEEGPDEEQAGEMAAAALRAEEGVEIERLLQLIGRLPPDTKLTHLVRELERLRTAGHRQVMIFTQYADTMDFLREALAQQGAAERWRVMSYAGSGGAVRDQSGQWNIISRDEAKRRFRKGEADLLVCTDAAAEGLNFQFCGALVNYDMPWNPMRVEQRIGRIDRLGQRFPVIEIVNLHYQDTVETDVYRALRERIGLFTSVVGKLQPILAQLPGTIRGAVLTGAARSKDARDALTRQLDAAIVEAQRTSFDIDEETQDELEELVPPRSPVTLPELGLVLASPALLPAGTHATPLDGPGEMRYEGLGSPRPVRVTTRPEYYSEHPDSVELWSPGSPIFKGIETDLAAPEVGTLESLLSIERQKSPLPVHQAPK